MLDVIQEVSDLYTKLLKSSYEKTELIKTNNIDELSKLLVNERKYNQQVEQLEQKRQEITDKLFAELDIQTEEQTVTELLNHLTDEQNKKQLEGKVVNLIKIIVEIKEVEGLNEELIQQSMQFVQLSLDLLQPTNTSINYNEKNKSENIQKRSVFDSKA